MRAALREYLRIMVRLWLFHALGMLSTVSGFIRDLGLISLVPSWIFYAVAVGLFIMAQFWAFYAVHKEVTGHRSKPKPNMRLSDVHDRVLWSLMQKDSFDDLAEPD